MNKEELFRFIDESDINKDIADRLKVGIVDLLNSERNDMLNNMATVIKPRLASAKPGSLEYQRLYSILSSIEKKKVEYKLPNRLMGYDECSVLRRCDTLILKTLHTYQLQDYSDVLQNTAKNIIHSAYEEKRKAADPKFKAALSADAASELLNQVKAALEEKAQELVSKEADGKEGEYEYE